MPVSNRDPFGQAYRDEVVDFYEKISGKSIALENEYTNFDFEEALIRPFPFSARSQDLTADYYVQLAYLLKALNLTDGVVADMGAGWGITTEMLVRSGLDVWPIDMNADFCRLIVERCLRQGLAVKPIVGDFFSVAQAPALSGAVFFESFHHCLHHVELLNLLHDKVGPGGVLAFAGEPIEVGRATPWGLRGDGMAVWSICKFGWLELGFDEDYFLEALLRSGWAPLRIAIPNLPAAYRAIRCGTLRPGEVTWPHPFEGGWAEPESDIVHRHRFTTDRTLIPFRPGLVRVTLRNFRPGSLSVRIANENITFLAGETRSVQFVQNGLIEVNAELWRPATDIGNDDFRTLGIAIDMIEWQAP